MKQHLTTSAGMAPHWVGDGFPVRTKFSHHSHGKQSAMAFDDYNSGRFGKL